VIRSYADQATEDVANGHAPRRIPPDILSRARRKLGQINAAAFLDDLRNPPGNRLEALSADRAGQHSIRINEQWRICFRWADGDAFDVEIVDYH
jgi:proteic killer suppression protein